MEVTVNQGDLFPDVEIQVTDENDAAIDITGATIEFTMRKSREPDAVVVDSAAGILTNGPEGRIAYRWQAGDTDGDPGTYEAFFHVTPLIGDAFKVPTKGVIIVYLEESF